MVQTQTVKLDKFFINYYIFFIMAKDTNAIATEGNVANEVGKTLTYNEKKGCTKSRALEIGGSRLKTTPLDGYSNNQLVKFSDIQKVTQYSGQPGSANITVYSDILMDYRMKQYSASQITITIEAELIMKGNSYRASQTVPWFTNAGNNWGNFTRCHAESYFNLTFTGPNIIYWPDETVSGDLIVTVYYHATGGAGDSSDEYGDEYSTGGGYNNAVGVLLCQMNGMLTKKDSTQFSGITEDFQPYLTSSDQTSTDSKSCTHYRGNRNYKLISINAK